MHMKFFLMVKNHLYFNSCTCCKEGGGGRSDAPTALSASLPLIVMSVTNGTRLHYGQGTPCCNGYTRIFLMQQQYRAGLI